MGIHIKILLLLTLLLKSLTDCSILFDDKTSWNYDDLISNPRSDRRISLNENNNDISFAMSGRKCKSNFRILNGMYRLRERGTFVRFSCSYGYILFGSSIALCVKGSWSHPPPVCVRGGCRKLKNPSNGISRSLYGGGVAGFQCGAEFSLIGSSLLTCNGRTWNGTEPICIPIPIEDNTNTTDPETISQDQNEEANEENEVTVSTQIYESESEKVDIQMGSGMKTLENTTNFSISASSPLPLPLPLPSSTSAFSISPAPSTISTTELRNLKVSTNPTISPAFNTSTESPTTIFPISEIPQGESTEESRKSATLATTLITTAKTTTISPSTETVTSNSNHKTTNSTTTSTTSTSILETTKQDENTTRTGESKPSTYSMNTISISSTTIGISSTLSTNLFSTTNLTTIKPITKPSAVKTKIVTYKTTLPTTKTTETTTTTATKAPKLSSTSTIPTAVPNISKTTLKSTEVPTTTTMNSTTADNFPKASESKPTVPIPTIPSVMNSTESDQYQTLIIDEGSIVTEPNNQDSLGFDEITPVTPVTVIKSQYKHAERYTVYEFLLYTFYIVVSLTFLSFFAIILIRLWRNNKGIARARSYDLDGRILRAHDGNEEFLWMQSHRETESDL